MQIICKNCGHIYSGQFCNNCGQPSDTHKLNLHFIWHDLQHAFLHFDKGVLFTAKELFTRPGNSIREFIEGKRVKHFKPISLVIILATLYGVLSRPTFSPARTTRLRVQPKSMEIQIPQPLNEGLPTHL